MRTDSMSRSAGLRPTRDRPSAAFTAYLDRVHARREFRRLRALDDPVSKDTGPARADLEP
jgi:hypothetical protein